MRGPPEAQHCGTRVPNRPAPVRVCVFSHRFSPLCVVCCVLCVVSCFLSQGHGVEDVKRGVLSSFHTDKRATSALVARWVKIADLDHDQTISKKELQIAQRVTAGEIAAQIKSAAVCTTVFSGLALASAYGFQVRRVLRECARSVT